ncbi:unnamed protein product [Acanthoscelides obtectus]|uniref:Uncharacterized protein n=1 Tax=Acanthoscelides obtectus TaxID=200917 RepID=A0A9P0PHY4_ACAOB|nr:unnamed protein product [Acanthoscelides obtectus]CAK1650480.1 hypothetical protein AOBTE_LOCUS16787 [Acanthoscelides obtectus]
MQGNHNGAFPCLPSNHKAQASTNHAWHLEVVYTLVNASVCYVHPSMADTELVSAITFGLTYFYFKYKQSKTKSRKARRPRRWWEIVPASGDSYKSLHYLFKVSVPMISKIIREVCQALNEVLKDQVKMPTTAEEWLKIEKGFRTKFHIP